MESFIIRIYKREGADHKKIVGLVEMVETEEKKAFTNIDELWEILKPLKKDDKHKKDVKNILKGGIDHV